VAAFETEVIGEQFPKLDVLDMMGAKGRSLEPPSPADSGLSAQSIEDGITANSSIVSLGHSQYEIDRNPTPFPVYIEEMEDTEGHAKFVESLIGKLASRKAREAIAPLGKAVDELREPIRTVAIACLYTPYNSKEEVAHAFGVPLELVEWLCDVALDSLATHVHID